MAKAIGYKPTTPNTNKGYKTHGKFVSSAQGKGQKPGKQGPIASKPAKEKLKNRSDHDFMKQTIATLRAQGKRRINMLPGTGAYH
jgi:hypothetical protein